MKGLPSHFGTSADVANCIELDPAGTREMLERLLVGRFGWVRVGELADGEEGVSDDMHEVRLEPVDPDADPMTMLDVPMRRVQYERQEDPLSELFRLGLTVQGVNEYIAECAGAQKDTA